MELLNSLVAAAQRFKDELLPVGYEYRDINWVIDIDLARSCVSYNSKPYRRRDMRHPGPKTPGDRTSGKVSPTLLIDDASHVLGIVNTSKRDAKTKAGSEHKGFIRLHRMASRYLRKPQLWEATLRLEQEIEAWQKEIEAKPSAQNPFTMFQPKDIVALRISSDRWLFDDDRVQEFWSAYLEKRLAGNRNPCFLCGGDKPSLRILPFNVRMFGQKVPIVAVNTTEQPAFGSLGKEQLENAPACYTCLGRAQQALQYLLRLDPASDEDGEEKSSGRHAVILSRDNSRGKGKQPLRNQVAVFWTKVPVRLEPAEGDSSFSLEDLAKIPLDELDMSEEAPPPETQQMRTLVESPFRGGDGSSAQIASNSFYLAVLSPNKTRLVVREWLEHDVSQVRAHIARYARSLRIIHPDGRGVWYPPLRPMLESLRSYTSGIRENDEKPRLPQVGPDVMRKLIRCMYTGTAPPASLLARAVRCFRVPDTPADGKAQCERQMLRRMVMAAAMKLVLTYDRSEKEQRAMEQLKTPDDPACDYKKQAPYRCGQMLAILEAVQRRASSSGRGVNSTLVDRFYGAASTAPATVFANLINMATKAHLPKLQREGKELFSVRSQEKAVNINDLMMDACDAINAAGGFPPPLTPEQQAQFALGFYHQRAELHPPKTGASTNNTKTTATTGGQL